MYKINKTNVDLLRNILFEIGNKDEINSGEIYNILKSYSAGDIFSCSFIIDILDAAW